VTPDLRATRLPPEPGSVSAARRFAAQAVRDLGGPPGASQEVQLLVSELATNAVVHAGTSMRLSVLAGPQRVRVEVRDDDPTVPASPSAMPSPTATGGRGILLVDAIADHWGVNCSEKGKTIWFELDRLN
jgi:sigma-B regulation protein RsbU (phosphoserine phosphatase)